MHYHRFVYDYFKLKLVPDVRNELWKLQVGSSVPVPGADHALRSIHNIKEALPEIWEGRETEHIQQVIQATAIQTVVLA